MSMLTTWCPRRHPSATTAVPSSPLPPVTAICTLMPSLALSCSPYDGPMAITGSSGTRWENPNVVNNALGEVGYLADEGIAAVVFLADRLGKPVLVEGPAGTGKTQLAKSVAEMTGSRLIRLQCYEGLDESKALYEWNYKKQLLRIQAGRTGDPGGRELAGARRGYLFGAFLDATALAGGH